MKKYLYLFFLLAFLSSCKKHDPVHYQFTDDEKKWIFYQDSNPTYAVYDFDTLTNVSGGDSIVLTRKQDVQAVVESWEGEDNYEKDNNLYYYEFGRAQLNPHLVLPLYSYILGYCIVNASKGDGSFHINITIAGDSLALETEINISTLDTALVQNTIFTNVYKLNTYPNNWIYDNFKCAYLAKNYGFIKIELKDGRKIELIKQ